MKKTVLAIFMLAASMSITGENMYPVNVEKSLDAVYDASCEYLRMEYDSTATDEEKICVIRVADTKDDSGDIIPEVDGYEEIVWLVWPKGYGEY